MQIEEIATVRIDAGSTTARGLFVVLLPEEAAGPSWKEALSGSGPGRFSGLVKFFFVVFLPSQLSRAVAPCSTSGQSPKIALFSSKNSDCKIRFKEENPMKPIRRTDGTRWNTPAAKISKSTLLNTPIADNPSLPVARKRAGFLGWSKGLMPTPIHQVSSGRRGSGRRGVALKRLN